MQETTVQVDSIEDSLYTWLTCEVEDLEYELPSGKIATSLTVTQEEAVFRASEDFGVGSTPYADSPDTHRDYLHSEDVAETDGSVEYTLEGGSIKLPKNIYFEEAVAFDEPITATNPKKIAERLQEELNNIEQIVTEVKVEPPDSL